MHLRPWLPFSHMIEADLNRNWPLVNVCLDFMWCFSFHFYHTSICSFGGVLFFVFFFLSIIFVKLSSHDKIYVLIFQCHVKIKDVCGGYSRSCFNSFQSNCMSFDFFVRFDLSPSFAIVRRILIRHSTVTTFKWKGSTTLQSLLLSANVRTLA